MPADSIPAAHLAPTEMSAHPVSKSSFKKRTYTIPRPSERVFIFARARQNSTRTGNVIGAKTSEVD